MCCTFFVCHLFSPTCHSVFFNLILYGFYRYKQELFVITVPTVVASKDCRLLGFVLCSWSNSLLLLISCGHVWFAVALTKARYSAVSPLITKKHRSLQSPAEGKKKKKASEIAMGNHVFFFFFFKKGCKGYENLCTKRYTLAIWMSWKGCALQGFLSSLSELDTRLKTKLAPASFI